MDPRHPELAISRMRELMKQYDRIEKDMGKATTSAQLGQLEREGGLVVQEICLVAPRIHEALIQTSRMRRQEIARGILEKCDETPEISMKNVETPVEKQYMDILEMAEVVTDPAPIPEIEHLKEVGVKPLDIIGEENIGGESKSVKTPVLTEKPKNAKTGKRKSTKKKKAE